MRNIFMVIGTKFLTDLLRSLFAYNVVQMVIVIQECHGELVRWRDADESS